MAECFEKTCGRSMADIAADLKLLKLPVPNLKQRGSGALKSSNGESISVSSRPATKRRVGKNLVQIADPTLCLRLRAVFNADHAYFRSIPKTRPWMLTFAAGA